MKYSSYRLAVVNLLIGMCRGSPGLPRTIRQMGYRDRWIPGTALGSRGAAADPVLVLTSTESRHSVFVQVFSGKQVDLADLDRYSKISAVHLREETSLTQDQTELYSVAVFGLEEHRESLRDGIAESRIRPTLLLRTPEGLVIDANPFPKVGLANAFRPVLSLDWDSIPLGWIPYDHGSRPAEIAQAIIPRVVARATGGKQRVEIAEICAEHPVWSVSTPSARRKMRTGVTRVLATAAEHEFRDFFTVRDGALRLSDLTREAVRLPGSPTLKRMRRHQGALLNRLQSDLRA